MKIMTNNDFQTLLHQIQEQSTVIALKNDMIDSQKEIIYDLIEENKALRSIINSQSLDFPNTKERGQGDSGTPKTTPDIFSEF